MTNRQCGRVTAATSRKPASRLPRAPDTETKQKLRDALNWKYPIQRRDETGAKSSVTALRRQAMEELDDEAEQMFAPRRFARAEPNGRSGKLSAAETGTAHHKFLQHPRAGKRERRCRARNRRRSGWSGKRFYRRTNARFWIWKRWRRFGIPIRAETSGRNAASVRRELPFTAKFSPAELAEIIGHKSGTQAGK